MTWCASLPLVDIPEGDTPKPVTLILPFYENAQFLRTQIGWWETYPDYLKAFLSAVIVDDGSPTTPAENVLFGLNQPFPIRLYRIDEDRPWNWLAARNIGAKEAKDGWCVFTDMDHVLPASTAGRLIFGQHDPSVVYAFSRREHTGSAVNPHSASFFMTRQMFWTIGGYEERFSGRYGSDGLYRRRLQATAPLKILRDRLIRHEYQGDSSTLTYRRKQPEDTAELKRIQASIPAGAKPKVLSFEYAEVPL